MFSLHFFTKKLGKTLDFDPHFGRMRALVRETDGNNNKEKTMSKDISEVLEKGSYYKVERFGEETHKFIALENDWMWVYFDPKENKTDQKRFLIKTTKVYSPNGKHYDIIPHFWLAKDGRGYYKPVPNGGFHIVPSQNHLIIDCVNLYSDYKNDMKDFYYIAVGRMENTKK